MGNNFLGNWTVQNSDAGQDLGSDGVLLLVGGTYQFLPNGYVNINLTFRDRAGQLCDELWVGRFTSEDSGCVDIAFIGGPRERFRMASEGQLVRESTDRSNVVEGSVTLLRN